MARKLCSSTVIHEEKSKVREELKLLPHLLPTKLGNVLLLQFIINEENHDKIGLRYIGFAIGLVTLAICLNASTMGFIFKSFTELFSYKPDQVRRVRKLAHYTNNTLCCVQIICTNLMFVYCLSYFRDVDYEDENSKFYVVRRIFILSFYVSAMAFVATALAIAASVYLYCIHKPIMKNLFNVKDEKFEAFRHLPPTSSYVIEIDLANVLLGIYIGIDEKLVGDSVHLRELALWVGVITMLMVMLDTIITLTLFITMRDGRLDLVEMKFFKVIHLLRYCMAVIQVLMFCVMLVEGLIIVLQRSEIDYRSPDNLLEISLVLSFFVVGGAIFASIVIIYLIC